ncbi:nucleotide exchange factor GrpE [Pedobacter sp. UYEF25]
MKKNTSKEEMEDKLEDTNEQIQQDDEINAPEEENVEVDEVSILKSEIDQLNDKYLRLYAEFDNFKRRTQKERIELLQTAGKDVIVSLLPALDDFDRTLKAMDSGSDMKPIKEGILLVDTKLKNILAQRGLKAVESLHKDFDTDFHEAITTIPAPSKELKDKVIDEVEKGYTLNDKVIRFAKVIVGG